MFNRKLSGLAGIEYVGTPGISMDCVNAVMRYILFGDRISEAAILTHKGDHSLLLKVNDRHFVAVKSGFSSGYSGEGPRSFSYILKLLNRHEANIEEHKVTRELLDRLDGSALKESDIESICTGQPVRPRTWPDYIYFADKGEEKRDVWTNFPPAIPFSIIDKRIVDLANNFFSDPDSMLLTGYRRLEDLIRKRTGVDEHGAKLFSQVFQGKEAKLTWHGLDPSERIGRGSLFSATFMAFRNPRAHREVKHTDHEQLIELLLLNSLFILESTATEVETCKDF